MHASLLAALKLNSTLNIRYQCMGNTWFVSFVLGTRFRQAALSQESEKYKLAKIFLLFTAIV